MTRDEAQERVARGAALLDVREPGWRAKVDPETLEMWSTCGCVVGQALDSFYLDALRLLDIDEGDEDSRHGFDIGPGGDDNDYNLLQNAWLELLGAKP